MMERKDLDDFDANGKKGDWVFLNDDSIIIVQVGDDHFVECALCYVKRSENGMVPVWEWNGSHDAPTLSPSILLHGPKGKPCRWHGYLRDGKLETLEYNRIEYPDIVLCDGG